MAECVSLCLFQCVCASVFLCGVRVFVSVRWYVCFLCLCVGVSFCVAVGVFLWLCVGVGLFVCVLACLFVTV